ncbi:hypothetical protein GPECTOR_6g599 [Gonium pectorale]|uniref:Uncharacterized protein n=1 Tax=Gonium pectorale TaxID=33097 RepID=A0A150GVF4_GONPE|nr:hypothetical protein GPECTOR_6g599 [Gonium pectorale]|eukprot:KXZ53682.1 hypothetical protein GPECTOR_6g599 [Gonium pectorale]
MPASEDPLVLPKPDAGVAKAAAGAAAAAPAAALPKPSLVVKPASGAAAAKPQPQPATQCESPCYTVADYWPYKTCRAECSDDVCKRGWGVWTSQRLCCSAGAAFPDGCSERPSQCWVMESQVTRTCRRDDRKCLQGNGVQSWKSKAACCAKGAAFTEGCSASAPSTPCYTVGSYWPARTCVASSDVAVCNRGWGVYANKEVCCAPNVAFPEGCSPDAPPPSAAAAATAADITAAADTIPAVADAAADAIPAAAAAPRVPATAIANGGATTAAAAGGPVVRVPMSASGKAAKDK